VPPGAADLTTHPDMRALFTVRGYGQRLALLVTERDDARAARAAGLLRGAGWQAVLVHPGEDLAGPWTQLTTSARRRGAPVG
jgi:hypothetical protein